MGEKFVVEWGELEVIAPTVLQRDQLSITAENGPGGTNFPAAILFDGAQVELQSPGSQLYGAWVGVIRLSLNLPTNPPAVWFKSDLRLSMDASVNTRAVAIFDIEGQTFVKELNAEAQASKQDAAQRDSPATAGIEHREFTFEFVHKAHALPARQYTASLLLLAERRDGEEVIRVSIDSLDIMVNPDFQSLPQRA
jgi:hypothetical protein